MQIVHARSCCTGYFDKQKHTLRLPGRLLSSLVIGQADTLSCKQAAVANCDLAPADQSQHPL